MKDILREKVKTKMNAYYEMIEERLNTLRNYLPYIHNPLSQVKFEILVKKGIS